MDGFGGISALDGRPIRIGFGSPEQWPGARRSLSISSPAHSGRSSIGEAAPGVSGAAAVRSDSQPVSAPPANPTAVAAAALFSSQGALLSRFPSQAYSKLSAMLPPFTQRMGSPSLTDVAGRHPWRLKAFRKTLTEPPVIALAKMAFPTKPLTVAQLFALALPQDWGDSAKNWPCGLRNCPEADALGVPLRLARRERRRDRARRFRLGRGCRCHVATLRFHPEPGYR